MTRRVRYSRDEMVEGCLSYIKTMFWSAVVLFTVVGLVVWAFTP